VNDASDSHGRAAKATDNQPPESDDAYVAAAQWGLQAHYVEHIPALAATLVAIGLYLTLPRRLYYGPFLLFPVLEGGLFLALLSAQFLEDEGEEWRRATIILFIAVLSAANIGSLGLLVHSLLTKEAINGQAITAQSLLLWSAQIWLTNVIVFGLWYWELDRGGPVARTRTRHRAPDFLFPQMGNPDAAPEGWTPAFFDYLYTSLTNAAAFSPTDTLPLTHWAKALFAVQSLVSLTTAVLVVARIANILPS
jgi:uncharacterized membrane protein